MRRESTFNKGGTYEFGIGKNLALHREAAATGIEVVAQYFSDHPPNKTTLTVLDLACGGQPLIISKIMDWFSSYAFEYTGVDINPDQVETCRRFSFSKNVEVKLILEGNAWDLEALPLDQMWDVCFIGLNTHHGTPEEIFCLAKQIFDHLKKGGLFLNHDVFRPAEHPYLRRPGPAQFIPDEKLQRASFPSAHLSRFQGRGSNGWRENWLSGYKSFMKKLGATEAMAEEGIRHMREWDYPISAEEMKEILRGVGFRSFVHSYTTSHHPFYNFYGMVAGYKD